MNLDHTAKSNGAARSHVPWKALTTGAAGAAAVTLAHEIVRQLVPNAPRIDRLGMSALARVLRATGRSVPKSERLRGYTLVGDLVANSMFYAPLALSGSGKKPWLRGLLLGAAAGLGALVLTPMLGLPRRHRGTTLRAQAITVALYATGGLVAGAVASLLERSREPSLGPAEAPAGGM
ncbi:MAG: hypothetical protein JWP87_2848 [Labilithrix sp.]|nr:hypothetical protein [Labilithrix sp.]